MKFENVVFPDSLGFKCRNCGTCCRAQPPDASKKEQKQIEAKGFRHFLDRPDENGTRWIRRSKNGCCFFLGEDNKCQIYSLRPAVCRLEPFTIADYDYGMDRILLELSFPWACGCEGVTEGKEVPFKEIAEAARAVVQKILEATAEDLGLPVADEKVARKARARIVRRRIELSDISV